MAKFHFEKVISSENLDLVKVKNMRGRTEFIGWDSDDIKIESYIDVSGTVVPKELMPIIEQDGKILNVKSGLGLFMNFELSNIKAFAAASKRFDGIFSSFETEGNGDNAELDNLTGQMNNLHSNTDITIFIPYKFRIKAECLFGPIKGKRLAGEVSLRAMNGPIQLSNVSGLIRAKTVNGPISIEDADTSSMRAKSVNGPVKAGFKICSGEISLSTVNGPVRLTVPNDSSLKLSAVSRSGPVKISSAFSAKMKSIHNFTGQIGDGDHPVSLKSFVGPISVSVFESSHGHEQPSPAETSTDSAESAIDRMMASGKISAEEARQLRNALI